MPGADQGGTAGRRSQVTRAKAKGRGDEAGHVVDRRGSGRGVVGQQRGDQATVERPALDAGGQGQAGEPAIEGPVAVGSLGEVVDGLAGQGQAERPDAITGGAAAVEGRRVGRAGRSGHREGGRPGDAGGYRSGREGRRVETATARPRASRASSVGSSSARAREDRVRPCRSSKAKQVESTEAVSQLGPGFRGIGGGGLMAGVGEGLGRDHRDRRAGPPRDPLGDQAASSLDFPDPDGPTTTRGAAPASPRASSRAANCASAFSGRRGIRPTARGGRRSASASEIGSGSRAVGSIRPVQVRSVGRGDAGRRRHRRPLRARVIAGHGPGAKAEGLRTREGKGASVAEGPEPGQSNREATAESTTSGPASAFRSSPATREAEADRLGSEALPVTPKVSKKPPSFRETVALFDPEGRMNH